MRIHYTLCFLFSLLAIALQAQNAPNFTIQDTDGNTQQLYEDYLDQGKTVLIKIFFTSCPACNNIAPATQQLYVDWGEGSGDVQFFELSNRNFDTNQDVAAYQTNHGITFPGAGKDGGSLTALGPYLNGDFGPFAGTPTFVVIAPDRSVNFDVFGSGNSGTIAALDAAIAATGATRPGSNPPPSTYQVSGQIFTEENTAINGWEISISDTLTPFAVSGGMDYNFPTVYEDTPIFFSVTKNDLARSQISTYDLVLISRHILGIDPLPSPYKILAADVNNSSNLSTFDLVEIRKVLLSIITEYPGVPEWKFVPACIDFSGSTDPFSLLNDPCLPEGPIGQDLTGVDFIGYKMGDANGSANLLGQSDPKTDDRSKGDHLIISVPDIHLKAGESKLIHIQTTRPSNLAAWQFGVQSLSEDLVIESVEVNEQVADLSAHSAFNARLHDANNALFIWNDVYNRPLETATSLGQLKVTAKRNLTLSETLRLDPALLEAATYREDGGQGEVQLVFHSSAETGALIFPNPNNGRFDLRLHDQEMETTRIEIRDMSGRLIEGQDLAPGSILSQWDYTDLPSGAYQLLLTNSKGTQTLPFVILP